MFTRRTLRFIATLLTGLLLLAGLACNGTDARPQGLTGPDDEHPRHATGVRSHSAD